MDDLKWFLGIMALLFLAWIVTGGPTRYESQKGPLIKPLPPVGSGEIYGSTNWFGIQNPEQYVVHPKGWQAINTQYFILYVPIGWTWTELTGGDTYRGQITNGTTVLTFEFGEGTNPLLVDGDPEYTITTEIIGTFTAKLVKPVGGSGTTGAYYKKWLKKNTLTITGENLSAKEKETAFTMFRSVRFKIVK